MTRPYMPRTIRNIHLYNPSFGQRFGWFCDDHPFFVEFFVSLLMFFAFGAVFLWG